MAELADAGAAGFTDDGVPGLSAGLMRRALQYGAVTGRRIALHCEETTLSRDGQMHEGAVLAELGFTGYPSVAESLMVERDSRSQRTSGSRFTCCISSAWESVQALRRARADGRRGDRRGDAAPSLPHRRGVRSLDPNVKMNPPLRAASDRTALVEG
jgi:dihydroorotase